MSHDFMGSRVHNHNVIYEDGKIFDCPEVPINPSDPGSLTVGLCMGKLDLTEEPTPRMNVNITIEDTDLATRQKIEKFLESLGSLPRHTYIYPTESENND